MAIEELVTEAIVRIIGGGRVSGGAGMVGGGAGNGPKMSIPGLGGSFLMVILVVLIVLLIKAFLVYVCFNNVVPAVIYSLDVKREGGSLEEIKAKFRKITYLESLLLVILTNTLFR